MKYILLNEIYGTSTCATLAKYIYHLIVYVKKVGDAENERIEREIDKHLKEEDGRIYENE